MQIGKEPPHPQTASLKLIELVAESIQPERSELAAWFNAYAVNQKERLAFDLDMVQANFPVGTELLEFGSIPLLLTASLQELGYCIQGVDIAPERFESSIRRLGLHISRCDIEKERLPFQNASFDGAIFNEIFEHLRINPIFTMREGLRILKPGGLLLLSTPNLQSLMGIANFLFHQRAYSCSGEIFDEYEKLEKLGHMGHVREYTPREVTQFLEQLGFQVEKVIFRGKYESPLARLGVNLFPRLRPFVTIQARKT